MGRTNEALQRAENEFQRTHPAISHPPQERSRTILPGRSDTENGAECYLCLKANLLNRYPDQSVKTIIFCGTAHGDGSTTTAANFAETLAGDCNMKVLLVDANLRTPCLHDIFRIDQSPGLSDYVRNGVKLELPLTKAGRDNLHLLPCGSPHSGPISLFEAKRFHLFLQDVRSRFDFVILDTPPIPAFSESRVICSKVDGAVLVIGAGKTRKQVAQRAKRELEESGGKVLGVVINRRKLHIPEWVYRRL